MSEREVWLVNLGVEDYVPVWDLQKRLVAAKVAGWPGDVLLLLEHRPVFTLGRQHEARDLLVTPDFLAGQGIPRVPIERGGKITYHGPGQIVGYPILDLHHFKTDVRWYHRSLAETIIRTLADYGLSGEYDQSYPGVWVGGKKVCAFGSALKRWISYHGFALNVDPSLEHWSWIIPCGLAGRDITTLKAELGHAPPLAEVRARLQDHFAAVFDCHLTEISRAALEAALMTQTL